jgi:hypothetical protein
MPVEPRGDLRLGLTEIRLRPCAAMVSVWLPGQRPGPVFASRAAGQTMTDNHHVTGRCLCGAVEISAQAKQLDVVACHCDMCRRWSSGPFMEINCGNVHFEGETSVGRIRSSDWAERGFCKECGSNLFYHIIGSNDYQISAGLLDDQSKLTLSLQVFTDRKPPFYGFANTTESMTGEEVAAMFAPKPD